MANFDANRWYQVLVKPAGNSQSLDGSVLFTQGQGTVFFKDTNTTDSQEQWQIFPYNSSYYVLITKASCAQGYLNTAIFVNETTLGGTVPDMRNTTQSDDSMFWQIHPWGDGTFYFTNAANRTAWHLEVNSNSQMAMSSNITAPQDGQSFTFNQLDAINDSSYSSVIVCFFFNCIYFYYKLMLSLDSICNRNRVYNKDTIPIQYTIIPSCYFCSLEFKWSFFWCIRCYWCLHWSSCTHYCIHYWLCADSAAEKALPRCTRRIGRQDLLINGSWSSREQENGGGICGGATWAAPASGNFGDSACRTARGLQKKIKRVKKDELEMGKGNFS